MQHLTPAAARRHDAIHAAAEQHGWEGALGFLARRHDVVAIRLFDPSETRIPDIGMAAFQDAETGEQLLVDTNDRGFRRRFAAAAQREQESLRASFARAGVDCLELSTEDDLLDAFVRFAQMRRQRYGAAGGAALPAHLYDQPTAAGGPS